MHMWPYNVEHHHLGQVCGHERLSLQMDRAMEFQASRVLQQLACICDPFLPVQLLAGLHYM